MADAVARAFEDGGVLLAEAGTGTGKTLAYLVPAILNRQRVLISTGTKNLQEQIFFKDIPALREALGVPFTATYMKGRANYLCLHRLDQLNEGADGAGMPLVASHDVFLPIIREWAKVTETLKYYGPVLQIVEIVNTATGNTLPWPTNDDTSKASTRSIPCRSRSRLRR